MKILKAMLIFTTVFCTLAADGIEIKTEGNATTVTNISDVVSYTNNRVDQQFIDNLSKKYDGLKDQDKINELLKNQNYIEVLNYLWTEPDHAKRLNWLKEKLPENHPILMFELASEYQLKDPTIETYLNKTMPWILAGARRTYLDALCSSDSSVQAAPELLIYNYQTPIVESLLQKLGEENFQKYVVDHADEFRKSNIAIFKKAVNPIINDENVPSAKWVFAHGMGAILNKKNTIDDAKCKEIRKKEVEEILKQASSRE